MLRERPSGFSVLATSPNLRSSRDRITRECREPQGAGGRAEARAGGGGAVAGAGGGAGAGRALFAAPRLATAAMPGRPPALTRAQRPLRRDERGPRAPGPHPALPRARPHRRERQ